MWAADRLEPSAVGVSASRRTDLPALFGEWFARRLAAGFVEFSPAGPARLVQRSLRPEHVTHFNFWSKWPRPFFRTLDRVLEAGYPVLWNLTITGLGGSAMEPGVPATEKAVAAAIELSQRVPPAAIQWRYDPVLLSERYDEAHHLRTFARLVEQLAGRVDRVATSFVELYRHRVKPDLAEYQRETGDSLRTPSLAQRLDLAGRLREIAEGAGIPFTLCCQAELRKALGCERSGCNSWAWARRVYPQLAGRRPLKRRPTRADCACSEEIDIGVYDTCTLGCRYSYGSATLARARRNFARHDPESPCLIP